MQNIILIHFINNPNNYSRGLFHYKISGQFILSDERIGVFELYKGVSTSSLTKLTEIQTSTDIKEFSSQNQQLIFKDIGLIGNAMRQCSLWDNNSSYLFQIDDIAEFLISYSGEEINIRSDTHGVSKFDIEEALIGPPLLLALAQKDIWCLHASAVSVNNNLVLFAGESGKGKSTLAHFIDQQNKNKIVRLTDDVTPLAIKNGSIIALPHYPQPKIQSSFGKPESIPEEIRVKAIFILDPSISQNDVTVTKLSKREAALALIRHTISSRLFPRETLIRHLDFSSHVPHRVQFYRLQYPHQFELLPKVMDKVTHLID